VEVAPKEDGHGKILRLQGQGISNFILLTLCFVINCAGETYSWHTKFESKIFKRINQYGVPDVDGMMILKWIIG
jgi:hypothetical protein